MLHRNDENKYTLIITPAGETLRDIGLHDRVANGLRDIFRAGHLIRLDLKQQAFGHTLGHLWLILEPFLQAATYYFLLTVVFNRSGSDATFAFFFVAITFWRSHAMLITSAPLFLVTKGNNYIEQGFGLNIAFIEFFTQEIVLFCLRFLVLIFFLLVAGYTPHFSWLAAVFVGACMFSFTLALSIWLAILGTIFKDSAKFVGHVVWLWWYVSPGLYSFDRIPSWAEPIFLLNPFSYIIPAAHAALLDYNFTLHHFLSNVILAMISIVTMYFGWKVLRRFGYALAQYV